MSAETAIPAATKTVDMVGIRCRCGSRWHSSTVTSRSVALPSPDFIFAGCPLCAQIPAMSPFEALASLKASLPADPALDDEHQRAVRLVVAYAPVLGLGGPEAVIPLNAPEEDSGV